jgi:hypothetical protein
MYNHMPGLTSCKNDFKHSIFAILDNGFLPNIKPVDKLPGEFESIKFIASILPAKLPDDIIKILDTEEPDEKYMIESKKGILNYPNAIDYRIDDISSTIKEKLNAYTGNNELLYTIYLYIAYISYAFVLSPNWAKYRKGIEYVHEKLLPNKLLMPLHESSKMLGLEPYSHGYFYLYNNYRVINDKKDIMHDNLVPIITFTGSSEEANFILHGVDVNRYSVGMIKDITKFIETNENMKNVKTKVKYEHYQQIIKSLAGTMKMVNLRKKKLNKLVAKNVSPDYKYNDTFLYFLTGKVNLCNDDEITILEYWADNNICNTIDVFTGANSFHDDDTKTHGSHAIDRFLIELGHDMSNIFGVISSMCKEMNDPTILLLLCWLLDQVYLFRKEAHDYISSISNPKPNGVDVGEIIANKMKSTLTYMEVIYKTIVEADLSEVDSRTYKKIKKNMVKYAKN